MGSNGSRTAFPIAAVIGLAALFAWLTWPPPPGNTVATNASSSTVVVPPRVTPTRARSRDPIVGDFFLLLDVSASVRPRGEPDKHADVLQLVQGTIATLKGLDEVLPIRVRVATIGDRGLDQRPVCDLYLAKPTLFSPADTAGLSTDLAKCNAALVALPATRYTDIRGSLKFAAEALESATPRLRGIILATDLQEELPPGSEPATPSLREICVITYLQTNADDARHPDQLDLRRREWSSSLTSWHVQRRQILHLAAFSEEELRAFFRGCEQ